MCLYADKKNPLKGKSRIRFDKDGYATCWKVYGCTGIKGLFSPYYDNGSVTNGWIVSNRESKKTGNDYGDQCHRDNVLVNQGIHVYTSKKEAEERWKGYSSYFIVPVRCHKSQLVAVSNASNNQSEAVFMKVFLKKADYDKVLIDQEHRRGYRLE
jgi:hypothetical protein